MTSHVTTADEHGHSHPTPGTYTKVGLAWIEENNMRTVLKRHIPALGPVLDKLDNAFKPWPTR